MKAPNLKSSGDKKSFENSPLLNSDNKNDKKMHSTIRPDKLQHTRFTDLRDEEEGGSAARILIYVIIIIAVGVGTALLVRYLISNNDQVDTTPAEEQEEIVENEITTLPDAVVVNLDPQDESVLDNKPGENDLSDAAISTLGSSTLDTTDVSLDGIFVTQYQTFSRVVFDFIGTETDTPKTLVSFDSVNDRMTVTFENLENINEELQQDLEIGGLVSEIRFDQTTNKFVLILSSDVTYRALANNGDLLLDLKSAEVEAEVTPEETPQPEEDQTPEEPEPEVEQPQQEVQEDTSGKPEAPHYKNPFSRDIQYVVSSATGKIMKTNKYWVWDQGSFFEFSFGQSNSVGNNYIPNSKAYLETEDGTDYIVWEIENLTNEYMALKGRKKLTAKDISDQIGLNMGAANFLQIEKVSFEDGKAVYKIQLKRKSDFRLLNQKTYDEKTQITSIQIKD